MSRCYVLGAGFSAPCGLPLARQLTELVFQTAYHPEFWQPLTRNTYMDLLKRLYPSLDMETRWPDFEDLMTVLDEMEQYRRSFEQTDSPPSGLSALHLKQVLLKHLGYYLCDQIAECSEDEMARVEEFVSMAAHNNHTIISFNWDVLVEVACEGQAIDVSYGGRITEGLQMAKPHGSLNLAEIERAEFHRMQNSINIHSVSLDYEDGNTLYVRADHASDAKNRIVSPFKEKSVVEPTARKSYLSGWIGLQWQRALQMLREADEIIVIGYSLPDTDFRPRILLQLSCWDEQHRPQFILVDPCVPQVVQKYERYLNAPIQTIAESWTTWLQSQS